MHARKLIIALILLILFPAAVLTFLWVTSQSSPFALRSSAEDSRIPIAILGDSDSHAYHDTIWFPPGGPDRGGRYGAKTWQWSELLPMLRGEYVDLGEWGRWGSRRIIAKAQNALGWGGRYPRKMDYRQNFAFSGATCSDLSQGHMRQQLIDLMNLDPARWRRGIVVIRMGVNDVGTRQALARWAKNGEDPGLMSLVNQCVAEYKQVVSNIHQAHPETRIVLVGLFDNSNWAPLTEKWQDPISMRNIAEGLTAFNGPLKEMAQHDPRLSFFDDEAWFRSHWGGRSDDGKPNYKVARINGQWPTPNSVGNSPNNSTLQDGHAGVIWNLLWAQALVDHINAKFATHIPNISEQELAQFLNTQGILAW